jgi:hypothetical protein
MPQLPSPKPAVTRAYADYVDDQTERLEVFVAALELAEDQEASFRAWFDRQAAETLLTRSVDGFLSYLGEILALVYEANPDALPSDAGIPVTLAPELQNRGAVVREMTARRVRNLSRKGIESLNRPFKILGFPLCRSEGERRELGRVVAQRDLIVHSRGVVDRSFRRRVPGSTTPIGETLPLSRSGAVEDSLLLTGVAGDIDRAAMERWNFDPVEPSVGSSGEPIRTEP